LTCAGTYRDLKRQSPELREEMLLTLYINDVTDDGQLDQLLADGVVHSTRPRIVGWRPSVGKQFGPEPRPLSASLNGGAQLRAFLLVSPSGLQI
jgi:hypothetical protein